MRSFIVLLIAVSLCVVLSEASGEIFLPGTQPEEGGIEFAKVQQCKMCHSKTKNGNADPFLSWQGGMMAQAARDPVFLAAMTIANQDVPGVGEFCLRCHAPRGWLEGRSTPADASALNIEDMHGVSCELCHRLVDPMFEEARKLAKDAPPSYGNSMMVADRDNTVRGPYGEGKGAMPHGVIKSAFHASGNLCGTCHDISNPLLAKDVKTQPVYSFGHIERTYSEWILSDFATQGQAGSCQSCHYPKVEGGGQASRFGNLHRDYFVEHGPAGGSTWIQDAVYEIWGSTEVDRQALDLAKEKTRKLLKTAAKLDLDVSGGKARLRVTNLTGHKLPSGYPEGRRMWINVRFVDGTGKVIKEIGAYGDKGDTIFAKAVTVPTLLDPDGTTVYEIKPGISDGMAAKYNQKPGASFHFVLNDIIVKDNRIPPKGFDNAKFAEHLSAPVGEQYADGQYWHDTEYEIPEGTVKVVVNLMYQSVSWEYMKFLAEENRTDDWGRKLYDVWQRTGKCPPEVITGVEKTL